MKTNGLTGPALDWAVAFSLGRVGRENWPLDKITVVGGHLFERDINGQQVPWCPTEDWSQGGPIIEREKIDLDFYEGKGWEACMASTGEGLWFGSGPTPLIAAMRCYVANKLGGEIDIPEELR